MRIAGSCDLVEPDRAFDRLALGKIPAEPLGGPVGLRHDVLALKPPPDERARGPRGAVVPQFPPRLDLAPDRMDERRQQMHEAEFANLVVARIPADVRLQNDIGVAREVGVEGHAQAPQAERGNGRIVATPSSRFAAAPLCFAPTGDCIAPIRRMATNIVADRAGRSATPVSNDVGGQQPLADFAVTAKRPKRSGGAAKPLDSEIGTWSPRRARPALIPSPRSPSSCRCRKCRSP